MSIYWDTTTKSIKFYPEELNISTTCSKKRENSAIHENGLMNKITSAPWVMEQKLHQRSNQGHKSPAELGDGSAIQGQLRIGRPRIKLPDINSKRVRDGSASSKRSEWKGKTYRPSTSTNKEINASKLTDCPYGISKRHRQKRSVLVENKTFVSGHLGPLSPDVGIQGQMAAVIKPSAGSTYQSHIGQPRVNHIEGPNGHPHTNAGKIWNKQSTNVQQSQERERLLGRPRITNTVDSEGPVNRSVYRSQQLVD